VDLTLFHGRKQTPSAQGRCRFVFMGRLVDWKRVDLLLEACALLRGLRFTLDVLGDGPLRAALEAQAKALDLSERVTFHGMLPQERCSALLAESDALVLPSLRECGGAVVLEAMACGLPVVATDWGGPADYLDADTGILVQPTSHAEFVSGLASAMRRLIEAPALRTQLGAAGRRRVEREFDWERKIDRMLEIYAEAARGARP
jgi:glycosyltransferase involved in cell wall biosynthesis